MMGWPGRGGAGNRPSPPAGRAWWDVCWSRPPRAARRVTDFGAALRAPIGRIHRAGTETAATFTGYMDGAVRSGERAATEVHGSL
jgi:monoamine oxidase